MKRDMDLIREILLKVEAEPAFDGNRQLHVNATGLGITGYADQEIIYNAMHLVEAGYLNGNARMAHAGYVVVTKLTWRGHEFLDSIRDPAIWKATKEGANKAGGFSVDLLGALAKGLLKTQIEKHTGISLDF